MPIEKILIEYAKMHLALIEARERVAALEAQVAAMSKAPQSAPVQP